MTDLLKVDWSTIPQPEQDGQAAHLEGMAVPSLPLASTTGGTVTLAELSGRTVLYAYPMTGQPGAALPEGWDMIPGARGCTPQSCSFRDHYAELRAFGVAHLFGISTQATDEQAEAADRLHLPFPLLSDDRLLFAKAMRLPVFRVGEKALLKRLTMIVDDGQITKIFYPVFPPDRSVTDVLDWLHNQSRP